MTAVVPADHRLAAADPALPGLRAVLDPLPLVRRLAPGWGAADAQVRYLRYKPGTSLVAGLLLTHDDGATSFAQALALRPDARDKLAKVERAGAGDDVGRGAALDGALGVALTDVTADRHLPGVRRVLRHPDDTVTPLVYKPGRRWVARRDRAGSPPALVKVHRPGILPGLRAGYQAVVGLPVPPVTRVHRHRGVVVTAWVPGTSLDRLTGPATEDLWARAGELIARVHRRPPLADLTRVDRAASLAAAVAGVRAVLPEVAADARTTAERVRAGLGEDAALTVVHGDFSADQVVVRPDLAGAAGAAAPADPARADQPPVTLVDLDRVSVDDPAADLASWYGALVSVGAPPAEPRDVLGPLLAGYRVAGGPADLTRLRLHCAAAVLQRSAEPFRRHLPDWPARVAHLVGVAKDLTA